MHYCYFFKTNFCIREQALYRGGLHKHTTNRHNEHLDSEEFFENPKKLSWVGVEQTTRYAI